MELVVVTGLSGSGKTTALRALEDSGFVCVDNLPAALLVTFMEHTSHRDSATKVAVAMDARLSGDDASTIADSLGGIARLGHTTHVLFLDCDDKVLVSRHKETRRRHPMMVDDGDQRPPTITEAIDLERLWLAPLRELATSVIDTSTMNVHELKRQVGERLGHGDGHGMTVQLMSFGFKHGLPLDADYAFDVRFIPNPYFEPGLRAMTGRDQAVADFVIGQPTAARMLEDLASMFAHVLPLCEEEGKTSVTVAIGCTGGQHRSVALVEALAARLIETGRYIYISHRDMPR